MRNQNGQSLVQVLISVAIMGILMAAMTSMQSNQARENAWLTQKLAVLDLQKQVIIGLANSGICMQALGAGKTLNVTNLDTAKPVISLGASLGSGLLPTDPPIAKVGDVASPITPSVVVSSINLRGFRGNPAGDNFTAQMEIAVDQTKLVRSLAPAIAQVTITTQPGTPAAAKIITGCNGPAVSPSGDAGSLCGSRYVKCGLDATHPVPGTIVPSAPIYLPPNILCNGNTLRASCYRNLFSDVISVSGASGCPSGYTATVLPITTDMASDFTNADGEPYPGNPVKPVILTATITCIKN